MGTDSGSVTKPLSGYNANYKERVTISVPLIVGLGRYFVVDCELAW